MNKANECTCPSGDGSLVHPCPAHPAVEQACWDERKLSDLGNELHNLSCSIVHENEKLAEQIGGIARELWNWPQACAALAQPSPASDLDPLNLAPHAEAFNEAPDEALRPEQAEAERSALWAVHAQGPDELYAAFSREDAEKHAAELNALPMPEGIAVGAVVVPSPWPAVQHWQYLAEQEQDHKNEIAGRLRQHERIGEALRAEITQLRQHKNDYMDAGQETYRALQNEIREREAEIARLDGLVSGHTAERDAALARVAELENGTVYVEARQCYECHHGGINDSADGLAACHDCDWTGPEPDEDKCPGCHRENCMAAACPECGGRYELVADANIAAPPAQAQHLHDLDKQCRDDVARALGLRPNEERGFAWSYLLASIKSCVKAAEDTAQAQHSVLELEQSRSALTEAQMRRIYENSTEAENERLGFAAFARLMRRAEAVHQIAAAPGRHTA